VIPRNVRLAEAPSFGKPIVVYDVLSAGSQSYLALAREMIAGGPDGFRDGAGARAVSAEAERNG
ncbi:MAG: ParA family protein, partial [Longimicrobiales bacterium]